MASWSALNPFGHRNTKVNLQLSGINSEEFDDWGNEVIGNSLSEKVPNGILSKDGDGCDDWTKTTSLKSMAQQLTTPVTESFSRHPSTCNNGSIQNDTRSSIVVKGLEKAIINSLIKFGKESVQALQSNPKSPLHSVKTFEELNLSEPLLKGIYSLGFQAPSKIQETVLPILLSSPPVNMIAQSQSGTGKTASFLLASLSRVIVSDKFPQVLILCPTYELASQVAFVATEMSRFMGGINIALGVKGALDVSWVGEEGLRQQVIVGTPGTLLDWTLKHKLYDIKKIKVFVLDEADIMINVQGHKDQCIRLHKHLPPSSQNLFFSATFDDAVLNFANVIIPDPVMVRLKREEESLDNIQQFFCHCQNEEAKYNAIANIFGTISMGQSFIFVATKAAAAKLHERLKKDGFPVGLISGDLTVEERNSIINKFRDGMQRVLIATNVIARGIDVAQVTLVINYDLPIDHETSDIDYETYLHRIGRTGRFGKFGLAINFVDSTWTYAMIGRLEKYFGRKITQIDAMDIDSMEALNRD